MPIKKSTIIKHMNFQYSKVYTHYFYWHFIIIVRGPLGQINQKSNYKFILWFLQPSRPQGAL